MKSQQREPSPFALLSALPEIRGLKYPAKSWRLMSEPVVVAYCLNAKKLRPGDGAGEGVAEERWRGGGLAEVLGEAAGREEGLLFVPFHEDVRCDVVVHKLTEDLMDESRGGPSPRLLGLRRHLARRPETLLVDPLEAVCRVTSRVTTHEGLRRAHRRCLGRAPSLDPAFVVAEDAPALLRLIRQSGMRFPLICKPCDACGTPNSHTMVRPHPRRPLVSRCRRCCSTRLTWAWRPSPVSPPSTATTTRDSSRST